MNSPVATPATDPQMMWVSPKTPTSDLASAISYAIYDGKKVTLRAMGAGAVNQAVKGIAKAQGYVAQRGLILVNQPGFQTVDVKEDGERTAMVFRVFTL